jgi:hypothetical protein
MPTNLGAAAPHLVTRILHLPITSDAEVFGATAQVTERVLVMLEKPGAEHREALGDFVIQAIESELERRGAAPPGWRSDDVIEAKLSDQLYRTRLLGSGGLALRFSELEGIADADGQLGVEDSSVLRKLLVVAEGEPLQLYLPEPAAALRVIGAPQRLSDWLTNGSRAGRVACIEYEPHTAAWESQDTPTEPLPDRIELSPPLLEDFVTLAKSADPTNSKLCSDPPSAAVLPLVEVSQLPRQPSSLPDQNAASLTAEQIQRCAAWATQLQNMSGPKVHSSVERAFVTAYLPLSREVAAGRAPESAQSAAQSWAEGFAQSYASAFKHLASRTTRPRMVKDVVEIAVRWLGQHHARQCQLLLVDGMRFDLAQRLNEEIERRLPGSAVCRDQALLWAALPSNAESQGIGESGAGRAARAARPKPGMTSHRAGAEAIESVRLGTRELFRLDQIAGDLTQTGEIESLRLQRLANMLADSIVPWMLEQPPETLVVVFGDHGFYWQATPQGTSSAQCGGALPEQVLVSASAWLLSEARAKARLAPGVH